MIEYASKTALEPRSHMKGFHEFVKESLSFASTTQTQMYEKARRLREKYEKNARGENPVVFAKSHEGKLFELSKKIWENNDGGNRLGNESVWKRCQRGSVGLRKEGEKRMGKEGEKRMGVDTGFVISAGGFCESVRGWSLDEETVKIVKDGLELISESKKVELEGKWEQLRMDEIDHYLNKLDLIHEQMILVLDANDADDRSDEVV
ncbi:hypothetical protein Vadar_033857 [Vaccinium darrowii]|uniref:Uncharacterized protein n=1 Tax=Vaccinium darrowii TaxID=229202 RepID=A0ACB7ZG90_9ERIC|nr:hypothetical protein Vadar_033857 [Vaccinium darrowii]